MGADSKGDIAHKAETATDPLKLDANIVQRGKRATVLIGNFEGGQYTASGTGVVCDDGLTVLTNKHVVTGTDDRVDRCKLVFLPGTPDGKIVTVHPENIFTFEEARQDRDDYHMLDVAAIRLAEKVVDPLILGESGVLEETDAVWAFSFPLGTEMRTADAELPSPTIHAMRVERIQRVGDEVKVLQLSGSPTYGSSGGAVITRDGAIVGILQAKARESSIVFAVPTAALRDMVKRSRSSKSLASEWYAPFRDALAGGGSDRTGTAQGPSDLPPRLIGSSILSQVLLRESDLEGLTAMQLTILRNEPFARRGYIFRRPELRQIFLQFDWYQMRTHDLAAVQATLTPLERRNVEFIRDYQRRTGLEW
jgi:hypothetical protein